MVRAWASPTKDSDIPQSFRTARAAVRHHPGHQFLLRLPQLVLRPAPRAHVLDDPLVLRQLARLVAQLPAAQSPWGVAVNWGMLMTLKDTTCLPVDAAHPSYRGGRFDCPAANVPIGHALPRWNFSVTQNFQWRRLSVYALFQGTIGRDVWNEARQWSTFDFITKDLDQVGRTVQEAKPIGYYFRGAPPTHSAGIGGFRAILDHVQKLTPLRKNVTTEDVANAAAFLCSDLAAGITGEILYVDAGYSHVGMNLG